MNSQKRIALFIAFTIALMLLVVSTTAHNPSLDQVPSPGLPAPSISIDGATSPPTEWNGAHAFDITSGAMGDMFKGEVKALHQSNGIYLQVKIYDSSATDDDSLLVMFDIDHNGGATVDAADFGIEIQRDPTNPATSKKWGPATTTDHTTWPNMPDANAARTSTSSDWTVELNLPTGSPSGLDLAANGGKVGVFFRIYNADNAFGLPSVKYRQWPRPPMATPDAELDATPSQWADYIFNPGTTFPSVSATDVRRTGGLPNTLSFTADNTFQVRVNNPGGTVIPNAGPCRLNLYLAARGIGDPWHRLDAAATINSTSDCDAPAANWPSIVLPGAQKGEVCTGLGPGSIALQDISAVLAANLNSPGYTIRNGVTRLPPIPPAGETITLGNNYYSVLTWNLTGTGQDVKFAGDRAHLCMKAEVLCPNDPTASDNTVQANMDFESIGGGGGGGGGGGAGFGFNLGNAGFLKYDPAVGKDMFLQVDTKNMNRQAGWDFNLEGVNPIAGDNQFVARLKGKEPIKARLILKAPAAGVIGRTLKENLMVPPKAGGFQANAAIPSGEPPVYVRVTGGTTLLIANYAFHANDSQNVDLDGKAKLLPPNGPTGLPNPLLQSLIRKLGSKFKLLLAPNAPLGALVGSWDNFQTAFLIGDGVQAKVPAGAKFLALGINDAIGFYPDNTGTGFRVKVVERPPGTASAGGPNFLNASFSSQLPAGPAPRDIVPIRDVMATLCINGYEDTGVKRSIKGTPRELFRFIGNVCWGIINVYPPNRSEKPDQGDVFDGPQVPPKPKGCGAAGRNNFALASFIALLGIVMIRRKALAKAKSQR